MQQSTGVTVFEDGLKNRKKSRRQHFLSVKDSWSDVLSEYVFGKTLFVAGTLENTRQCIAVSYSHVFRPLTGSFVQNERS